MLRSDGEICILESCWFYRFYTGWVKWKHYFFHLEIYWTQKVHNEFSFLCSLHCAAISFTVTWRFSLTMPSTAAMPSGVTTGCAWTGRGESVTELMAFMNCLVHRYTCCSDRHASPYWTVIGRWISMGFTPSLLKENGWQNAVLLWCMLQAGPPSLHHYCAVVLYSCIVLPPVGHSSNLSITVVNLKSAVFRIFIALWRVSFYSSSYIVTEAPAEGNSETRNT